MNREPRGEARLYARPSDSAAARVAIPAALETVALTSGREGLLAIRALPPRGTDGYFREWQAIFSRADLTPKEVRLLEHMARKMVKAARGAAEREPS